MSLSVPFDSIWLELKRYCTFRRRAFLKQLSWKERRRMRVEGKGKQGDENQKAYFSHLIPRLEDRLLSTMILVVG